jgi:hypothetical protein
MSASRAELGPPPQRPPGHFIVCQRNFCRRQECPIRDEKRLGGSANSPPRLDLLGAATPLGPLQYSSRCPSGQEAAGSACRLRPRRCLLKGCERFFRPSHPRDQYCSDACRREAKKWRAWRAAGQWRQSERGKERRRAQSRRYRRLIPLPVLVEPPTTIAEPRTALLPPAPAPPPTAEPTTDLPPASAPATTAPVPAPAAADPTPAAAREGQRFAAISEDLLVRACRRPGCYELFCVPTEHSLKRFCCTACRKALGRVRERESRYHQRRRAGFRPRRRHSRPAPKPRK